MNNKVGKIKSEVIEIEIKGRVSTGKSAVVSSIKKMLEDHGYCVAVPERQERHNPNDPIDSCAWHEKPNLDDAVFVLRELVTK